AGIEVSAEDPVLLKAIPYVRPRSATFVEVAEAVDYFLRDVTLDEKSKRKFLVAENADVLVRLAEVVAAVDPFHKERLEEAVDAWLEEEGLPMKHVAQPARVAMTGRTRSPGLFEVMEVLGRQKTLDRLRSGAEIAASTEESSA
ncbi:MAG: hypothetical protein WCE62_03400, partial [Polyangiales bacterium]